MFGRVRDNNALTVTSFMRKVKVPLGSIVTFKVRFICSYAVAGPGTSSRKLGTTTSDEGKIDIVHG